MLRQDILERDRKQWLQQPVQGSKPAKHEHAKLPRVPRHANELHRVSTPREQPLGHER